MCRQQCACLRRRFQVDPKFGFSRSFQWLFTLVVTIVFAIASKITFSDWKPFTHIPYDVSTCWLIGSYLGRLFSEAIATYPWTNASGRSVHYRIILGFTICGLNTAFMRSWLDISGHVCNA